MRERLNTFFKDQGGATAIEYTIMAASIAFVLVTAIALVGDDTLTMFNALPDVVRVQ